jgi:hypothetical protein
MEGGELFQRIKDRQDGAFTERGKMWEVVELLSYSSVSYTAWCMFTINSARKVMQWCMC